MFRTSLRRIFYFLLIIITYSSCEKDDTFPVDIQAQDFVWKGFNAYYLYQDQVDDLSDRRFNNDQQLMSYLSGFGSATDIFNALVVSNDTRSVLVDDYNLLSQDTPLRSSFTTGLEFGVMRDPNNPNNVIGYVLDILPNSNASNQNISRGEFFYAVVDSNNNTIQLTEDNYTEQLTNAQQLDLSILTADFDGTTLTPNGKQVDLVREQYQHPPIHFRRIIDAAPNRIGYLMYNNDFSGNYIQDLNATMLDFQNNNVNQLIIDLRYNIGSGSFASTVAELASMITRQFDNQPLIKETWNVKAQPWFEVNQPDSLITRFPTSLSNGTAINSLNLTDVYIILNGRGFRGSSALELLVNSLRPYINVHVIGNNTIGDNLGSITLYDSIDYNFSATGVNANHTFALQPTVLTFSNVNDETYSTGISPTMTICPVENPMDLGELGQTSDPLLNSVLNYITNGTTVAPACNPFDFEILYNSINQQILPNRGVFIEQHLPNLGR